MANLVTIKFDADISGLKPAIDILEQLKTIDKQTADHFRAANQERVAGTVVATKATEKLAEAAVAVVLDKTNSITKAITNVQSLKAQFKAATNEVGKLTAEFGALDARTLAAAKNAGSLKNQIGDVNKQINALNPEAKFNAFIGVTRGLSGALFAAQGAMTVFGSESEKTKEILSKFTGAINLAYGLNQLGGLKSAFTALASVLGVTNQLTQGQASALGEVAKAADDSGVSLAETSQSLSVATNTQKLYTIAAGQATKAQAVLNKTILANPYVLAAAAVAALVTAFVLLSKSADDTEENIRDVEAALNDINKISIARKRIDDEFIQELQGQIDLKKAQGANDKTISVLQSGLQKQKLADLAAEKKQLEDNFSSYSGQQDEINKNTEYSDKQRKELQDKLLADENKNIERRKAIPAEEKKISNDILIIGERFQTESREKDVKFGEERIKAKKELALKIRQAEIDAIPDDGERGRAQLIFNFDKEVDIIDDNLDKKLITYAEFNNAVVALQDKLTFDLSKSQVDADKKLLDQTKENQQKALVENEEDGIKKLEIEKEHLKRAAILLFQAGSNSEEAQQNLYDNLLAIDEIYYAKKEALLLKSIEDSMDKQVDDRSEETKRLEAGAKLADEKLQEQSDLEDDKKDIIIEAAEETAAALNDIIRNNTVDAINQETDAQLNKLEQQKDKELENKRLTAAQKKAIEEKYQKEEGKIKTEAAKKIRTADITQAGVNTLLAVTSILADHTMPTFLKPFAIAAATLTGALNVAAITSKPLPQYHKGQKGRDSNKEQLALVLESEDIFDPETSRAYRPLFSAIHNKKISPQLANAMVLPDLPVHAMPGFSSGDISNLLSLSSGGVNIDYDKLGYYVAQHFVKAMEDTSYKNRNANKSIEDALKQIKLEQFTPDPRRK